MVGACRDGRREDLGQHLVADEVGPPLPGQHGEGIGGNRVGRRRRLRHIVHRVPLRCKARRRAPRRPREPGRGGSTRHAASLAYFPCGITREPGMNGGAPRPGPAIRHGWNQTQSALLPVTTSSLPRQISTIDALRGATALTSARTARHAAMADDDRPAPQALEHRPDLLGQRGSLAARRGHEAPFVALAQMRLLALGLADVAPGRPSSEGHRSCRSAAPRQGKLAAQDVDGLTRPLHRRGDVEVGIGRLQSLQPAGGSRPGGGRVRSAECPARPGGDLRDSSRLRRGGRGWSR